MRGGNGGSRWDFDKILLENPPEILPGNPEVAGSVFPCNGRVDTSGRRHSTPRGVRNCARVIGRAPLVYIVYIYWGGAASLRSAAGNLSFHCAIKSVVGGE